MSRKVAAFGIKDLNEKIVVEAIHRYLPREKVEKQVMESGIEPKRDRKLGAVLMVFFMLYQSLFRESNRKEVLEKLIEGYRIRGWKIPPEGLVSRSGICRALRRTGVDVMKRHYEELSQGNVTSKESVYQGLRLKAYDGSRFNVEDSPENREAFAKPPSGNHSTSAWPQLKLVMEMDLGTRQPIQIAYGGCRRSDIQMVYDMLEGTKTGELILLDRGLGCYKNLEKVAVKGGEFLARIEKRRMVTVKHALADGSYLGVIRKKDSPETLLVRVIEYQILNPERGNTREKHRLITSLLDDKTYPVLGLIELYHQRWEIEIGFDELKTHLFARSRLHPFFRSHHPEGVIQELYATLLLYTVIRLLMQESAKKYDLDPRRLSFTQTVHILRRGLIRMQAAQAEQLPYLFEELLDQIASTLLPLRDNRINPRVVRRRNIHNFPVKRISSDTPRRFTRPFIQEIQLVSVP